MEVAQVLHMNKGEGESSYAKNSTVQKKIISIAYSIIGEALQELLSNNFPENMRIADLGCSSGPNTLTIVSEIINVVHVTSRLLDQPMPELQVSLNDLPGNDFNDIFLSLPEFYNKLKEEKGSCLESCYISGVPGSFYGRLFPRKSQHFIHSSSSLHWLSQVPPALDINASIPLNKGKIYISKTSPESVINAYLSQFQSDFSLFLKSRSEEMVPGGRMILSFMARVSSDPASEESCHQWELLARALMSMASEGLIEEEKIDSFNAPYYAPSVEEVKNEIEREGSFIVNRDEVFEIDWDAEAGGTNHICNGGGGISHGHGERVSKNIRAVVESMLEAHFGKDIMDEFFKRFTRLVDEYFTLRARPHYIDIVISLTRKV